MIDSFLQDVRATLERTPAVLDAMLRGLPEATVRANAGEGTWSPYAVVGHLIHGERTDWVPRLEIILQHGPDRPFDPFDREAQFGENQQRPLDDMLDDFRELRIRCLHRLAQLVPREDLLDKEGMHPALGRVTARQLLATWAAHDLGHILQISRVLARRYREEVGPWAAYMSVMQGGEKAG